MDLPDRFASFFDQKIRDLLDGVKIQEDGCNGPKKINSTEGFFMDKYYIKDCLQSLKPKNGRLWTNTAKSSVEWNGCTVKPFDRTVQINLQ
jgi:hypothetical protein